jgi:7-cyano-7-deazaguanine synthase
MTKAVAIVSGGMDSAVLAYQLAAHHGGRRLHFLSFNYGQRHAVELKAAEEIASRLNAKWSLVDLRSLGELLPGSSLTDPSVEVPEGHYEAESMKATVVPNRNAIMLSIAFGIAFAEDAQMVGAGFHAGDHHIYPDCRPEFTHAFQQMQDAALAGLRPLTVERVSLYTPFIHVSKAEIVRAGQALRVPFEITWSCYKGGQYHCSRCGTCTERIEAFKLAGVPDPTVYEDGERAQ